MSSSFESIHGIPSSTSSDQGGGAGAAKGRVTPTLMADSEMAGILRNSNSSNSSSSSDGKESRNTMMRPPSIAKRPSAQLKPDTIPSDTNWTVSPTNLKSIPSFYPLEKSSCFVKDTPSNVASRLSDACRLMSVQATYDDALATADLITEDHVEIHLTLWRGEPNQEEEKDHASNITGMVTDTDSNADTDVDGDEEHANNATGKQSATANESDSAVAVIGTTIVEAQRRKGCAVVYHRYCKNLLDAAQGCFEMKGDMSMGMAKHPHHQQQHRVSRSLDSSIHMDGVEKKEEEEHKSALYALEIAASLLKKDRMDARRLGMESLCLLTDPCKTGLENAIVASQVVLFGSVQEAGGDILGSTGANTIDTNFIPDELGIREAILSLVQFGKLRENCDFDSDSDDDENISSVEVEFNDILHNLALGVLANALEVHEMHGLGAHDSTGAARGNSAAAIGAAEDSKPSANAFLSESQEISKRELLSSLLSVLGKAASKPHDACLSAQCLRSLFQASKEAKKRAKDLNAKQIVMTALDVGRRTHVKLETETENVIKELERPDDDEGVARGSGGTGTNVEYQHDDENDSEEE